jgi:hypothetical protein
MRALAFVVLGLRPGVIEELCFVLAADEFSRAYLMMREMSAGVSLMKVVRTCRGGSGLETVTGGSA